MTISSVLMKAILSMDAYNRGYNPGVTGIGDTIGTATLLTDSQETFDDPNTPENEAQAAEDASFYASAYTYNGETIISFRGTDDFLKDPFSGWSLGTTGSSTGEQAVLAVEFYKSVIDKINETLPHNEPDFDLFSNNISFTGHSMGGGFTGLLGSVYGKEAKIFDSMAFEAGAQEVYKAVAVVDVN